MKDIISVDVCGNGNTVANRAAEVREKLLVIRKSLQDNFFDLCELLLEAQEGDYHRIWGFARFGDWVEQGSDLDISARQAYYFVNIARKLRPLHVAPDVVRAVKVSKVKEICRLRPYEHFDEMKRLITASATAPLEKVKAKVDNILAQGGAEPQVFMTIRVNASIKDTIERAFDLARRNYGDNADGQEASDTQCLELICLSYVQDPNNNPSDALLNAA